MRLDWLTACVIKSDHWFNVQRLPNVAWDIVCGRLNLSFLFALWMYVELVEPNWYKKWKHWFEDERKIITLSSRSGHRLVKMLLITAKWILDVKDEHLLCEYCATKLNWNTNPVLLTGNIWRKRLIFICKLQQVTTVANLLCRWYTRKTTS